EGGAGYDSLQGQDGDDVLKGGDSPADDNHPDKVDVLSGGKGIDQVDGEAGNDRINWQIGDGADALMQGGDGNDHFNIITGDGADNLTLDASGSSVVATLAGSGGVKLTMQNIEGFSVDTRGGADSITVGDMSGTSAQTFSLSLGGTVNRDSAGKPVS